MAVAPEDVPVRLENHELRIKALEDHMKGNGVWLRWAITTIVGALAAYGAVLAAEIARH